MRSSFVGLSPRPAGVAVRREDQAMHTARTPGRLPVRLTDAVLEAAPDRLPKPPAHPPAEPIIIKVPPQPRELPEIERPDESEDDDGIRRAPWMPDMPLP